MVEQDPRGCLLLAGLIAAYGVGECNGTEKADYNARVRFQEERREFGEEIRGLAPESAQLIEHDGTSYLAVRAENGAMDYFVQAPDGRFLLLDDVADGNTDALRDSLADWVANAYPQTRPDGN